jgi:peptidoglycan L-alanyl-D-glutamate endopeptidase CwlK
LETEVKMDRVTIDRIGLLHPRLRSEAMDIYEEICEALKGRAMCRFTHTLRTFKEQDELYAKGRTAPGSIVTKAKAGMSMHNYGMAIDIVLIVDTDGDGNYDRAVWYKKSDFDNDRKADWMEVVQVFKSYGWVWGGDWKFYDAPHFEKSMGYSVRELLNLKKKKKVDRDGYVSV